MQKRVYASIVSPSVYGMDLFNIVRPVSEPYAVNMVSKDMHKLSGLFKNSQIVGKLVKNPQRAAKNIPSEAKTQPMAFK